MSADPILDEIRIYRDFFEKPIALPLEKNMKEDDAPIITQQKSTKKAKPKTQESEISVSESIKDNHNYITPDCKCFFISIKPDKSASGVRQTLLYAYPYCAILNEDPLELEILPKETKYYIEGRNIFVVLNRTERKYSIKSKLEMVNTITSGSYQTYLIPFFMSALANGWTPPTRTHEDKINHITSTFFYKTIYCEEFLESFAYLPNKYRDDSDLLDSWVRAADPMMDKVIESLAERYFRNKTFDRITYDHDNFLFKIACQMLSMDENFNSFANVMATCQSNHINFYLRNLETCPFNDRSQMLLHLLFAEAQKAFPETAAAGLIVSLTIFHGSLLPIVAEINPNQDLSDVQPLAEFTQTTIRLEQLKLYEKILTMFRQQPGSYVPVRKGAYAYDGFCALMKCAEKDPNAFLNAARNYENY